MITRIVLFLFVAQGFLGPTSAQDECCLCKFGRWNEAWCFPHVDKSEKFLAVGVQCVDLATESLAFMEGSGGCDNFRDPWVNDCCRSQADFPTISVPQPQPTRPPSQVNPEGNQPLCNICFNGQFLESHSQSHRYSKLTETRPARIFITWV
jgi:hypothetical protein